MKNSYIIILICAFLSIGQKAFGESVTKTVHFSCSELICDTITGADGLLYNTLTYPGTDVDYNYIGCPALPVKYVTILLPYTADDISLSIQCSNITSHVLANRIFPIQEQEVTSIDAVKNKFTPCESSVYESVVPYPIVQARIVEVSCIGYGDRYVVVAVSPVSYYPADNRYDFCEEIELILSYNLSSQRAQALTRRNRTTDIGIPFYEYCVITSRDLMPAFTRLIAWKREKGLNAGVVCIEDILNNTYIVGDTVSSYIVSGDTVSFLNDDAGKVRQYLQYAYNSGMTKYVMFGGNYEVTPIRYGIGSSYLATSPPSEDDIIPSDFYFSELNSNWNKFGHQYYGQSYYDFDYGSELYVGRLLCTKAEEIHNYTDKLLRYELNPGNGDFSYLKKALYTQVDDMQEGHEQDSVATQLHCIFPLDTIFSETPSYICHHPTSPYGNEVIAKMNEHYGYVSWGGHGGPYNVTVKADSINKGNYYAILSVHTTLSYIMPESANGLDNLTNKDFPMFAYSTACTTTPFDIYKNHSEHPNMGESFTLGKDYGGPVFVGNTREGRVLFSAKMQMKFNEYLMNDPMVGAAQNYAKMNCSSHYLRHSSNIIGCPNVRIWTNIPKLFTATLSYNTNNYTITANNAITDAEINLRNITQVNETTDTICFNPSQGAKSLTGAENSLITLTGKNCLPQIMPLTIQKATLQGTHYAIVKDVACGRDVRGGNHGNVTFDGNSDYTFETNGTFKLTKGVKIEQGAQFKVIPSEINY
ncbi:MAG: hypothetical protein IJT11_09630 [Bacteroidaceae bacterium]|nr:hypothetical protein [Bacteroidaceae bacterium]